MPLSIGAGAALSLSILLSGCCLEMTRPRPRDLVQAECKSNLKALYTAQREYFSERDEYLSDAQKIGFEPQRGNRYAYFLGSVGFMQLRNTEQLTAPPGTDAIVKIGIDSVKNINVSNSEAQAGIPLGLFRDLGVHGQCPSCSFIGACSGNLDDDPVMDVWSISTEGRMMPDGTAVAPGIPYNEVDDITR